MNLIPTPTRVKIGPADHGRRMSLAEFEHAEVVEGRIYELGRGVIVVSDVPNPPHLTIVQAIRLSLYAYILAHPGRIHAIAAGSECKVLVFELESERHPDIVLYKTPPPAPNSTAWRAWIPELVVEIVSPGSENRDYVEKREEYLRIGIREYWIVNGKRKEIEVLVRRSGQWAERILRPGKLLTTRQLPGFRLDVTEVFATV